MRDDRMVVSEASQAIAGAWHWIKSGLSRQRLDKAGIETYPACRGQT